MNPPDSLSELIPGSCGRGKRGSAQFFILGEKTLTLLADRIKIVSGRGTDPASFQERAAEVTPHLFVRFSPGANRNGDALDLIEEMPGRRDRSFSIIGRERIEWVHRFIADEVNLGTAQ